MYVSFHLHTLYIRWQVKRQMRFVPSHVIYCNTANRFMFCVTDMSNHKIVDVNTMQFITLPCINFMQVLPLPVSALYSYLL